jgi:thioredoxin-like negative regulator of GroEL
MHEPDLTQRLAGAVADYRRTGDIGQLLDRLDAIARAHPADQLLDALTPHRDLQEVVGPVCEVIVEREPTNARALVALAQAYWLTGRGPEVVSEIADRARTADPSSAAAWHLWALADGSPRGRTERWQAVVARFPDDAMARVNLADNAAGLAGAEDDPVALKLAIATYEELLARATRDEERTAVSRALEALRGR